MEQDLDRLTAALFLILDKAVHHDDDDDVIREQQYQGEEPFPSSSSSSPPPLSENEKSTIEEEEKQKEQQLPAPSSSSSSPLPSPSPEGLGLPSSLEAAPATASMQDDGHRHTDQQQQQHQSQDDEWDDEPLSSHSLVISEDDGMAYDHDDNDDNQASLLSLSRSTAFPSPEEDAVSPSSFSDSPPFREVMMEEGRRMMMTMTITSTTQEEEVRSTAAKDEGVYNAAGEGMVVHEDDVQLGRAVAAELEASRKALEEAYGDDHVVDHDEPSMGPKLITR